MAALAVAVLGTLSAATIPAPAEAQPSTRYGQELVRNGNFTHGTDGWRTNLRTTSLLRHQTPHHGGAAALKDRPGSTVVLNDKEPTIGYTRAGTSARVQVRVRAARRAPLSGELRVREVKGGQAVAHKSDFWLTDKHWTTVTLDVDFAFTGGTVDLNVLAWNLKRGQRLLVDNISMRMIKSARVVATPAPDAPAAPAPSTDAPTVPDVPEPVMDAPTSPISTRPAPSTPAPTTPAPETGSCGHTLIGLPTCGAYFGAAYGGNTDPTAIEKTYGRQLGVRRTYFSGGQVDAAVRIAAKDLAAGRLPWISFKLPYSWADMAAGRGDAWALDLVTKLDRLNGPVWLAFHHEPEGDGPIQTWTAMQRHLGQLVKKNSDSVAFTLVITGWHELYGDAQYSLDRIWPGDGLVDVLGADVYQWYGVTKSGRTETKFQDLGKDYYTQLDAFTRAHGTAWGIAETGYTDRAFADHPGWIQDSYRSLIAHHGVAYAYFDTDLNPVGDSTWALSSAGKRAEFARTLRGSISLTD